MTKKQLSTFEREMQDSLFREQFETEYSGFLLSEIINVLMKNGIITLLSLNAVLAFLIRLTVTLKN
ncbi:hypothetical protein [Legionella waltersii]|uniref:Uncharacterized protein n=1 Tax=Legionella waltersii TaxID=66969 RepID=A0A0W1A121_9GAMM|nr:hypothetical protein [Legionella waltersii]KTD74832.1 hypothetical protein Lwal_2873 [Legionella waltersii]SNV11721.1 Uncharacterised protein [Legionella waltersii]